MSDDLVFVEGRNPATKRALDAKAIEAGIDLNSMRVAEGGYLVPAELAPKKESGRKSRAKKDDDAEPDEGEN